MPVTLNACERSTGTVPVRTGVTATLVVAACEREPDTPVTVIVAAAGGVAPVVVRVKVLSPVVLAGLNEAVTPAGSPDAVRVTGLLKLPLGIATILVVAVFPCGIEILPEDADRVKSVGPALGEGSTS